MHIPIARAGSTGLRLHSRNLLEVGAILGRCLLLTARDTQTYRLVESDALKEDRAVLYYLCASVVGLFLGFYQATRIDFCHRVRIAKTFSLWVSFRHRV